MGPGRVLIGRRSLARGAVFACGIAALFATACGSPEWRIVFQRAEDRDATRVVLARVHVGSCDGAVTFSTSIARDAAGMSPPTLAPGLYGFEASAIDASCAVIARACTLVEIPTSRSVTLTLEGVTPEPQCAAASCSNGTCSAPGDAGPHDAFAGLEVGPSDAGIDAASVDAPTFDTSSDARMDVGVPDDGPSPGFDGGVDAGVDASFDAALDAVTVPDAAMPLPPTVVAPWNGVGTGTWLPVMSDVTDPPRRPLVQWRESIGARSYVLEWIACASHDLSTCSFASPDARTIVDDVTFEARPTVDLPIDEVTPGGRRYAFRVGACAMPAGVRCAYSSPRYLDVARHPQDVDGNGTDEMVVTRASTVEAHRGIGNTPSAILTIASGATLGTVAYAGDYDADGRGDVAIDVGGPTGRFEIRRGDGSLIGGVDGPSASALFGSVLAGTGDVDGDGYADLAVGAPGADTLTIYFGGDTFDAARSVDVTDLTDVETAAIELAHAGDRDGDGLADLVVGSRLETGRARIDLYSFAGRTPLRFDSITLDSGETDPAMQPRTVSLAGGLDLDGDARPEILVGLWCLDTVIAWTSDGPLVMDSRPGETGRSVAVGDLAGSGVARGVVGSPRQRMGASETGYYGHLSLLGGGVLITWISIVNPDGWGRLVSSADLDADGRDDMITIARTGEVGHTGRFSGGMVGAGTNFRFLFGNGARFLARW